MFIRRKFTVTSDGHNFQLDREFNRESSSDEYEVDYRVKHIRESSGKTKRQQATRRGLDNGKHQSKKMGRRYMKSMNGECKTVSIEQYLMKG
tara:strand:- start:204 stop:479 length:276 start_codon:yes stop_codon:yes gene_type:complete